jgi:hypothetical protein
MTGGDLSFLCFMNRGVKFRRVQISVGCVAGVETSGELPPSGNNVVKRIIDIWQCHKAYLSFWTRHM